MATRRSAWIERAFTLLEERGSMLQREVLAECAYFVPPGHAHRRAERARLSAARVAARNAGEEFNGVVPERSRPLSDEDIVYQGGKAIVYDGLHGQFRSGHIERFEKDGELWLRLPGDPTDSWRDGADGWLDRQGSGSLVTADDLVAEVAPPDGWSGVGGWFAAKERRGLVRFTGETRPSKRLLSKGHRVRVYEVVS